MFAEITANGDEGVDIPTSAQGTVAAHVTVDSGEIEVIDPARNVHLFFVLWLDRKKSSLAPAEIGAAILIRRENPPFLKPEIKWHQRTECLLNSAVAHCTVEGRGIRHRRQSYFPTNLAGTYVVISR